MSETKDDYYVAVLKYAFQMMVFLDIEGKSKESTIAAQANILARLQTAITRDTMLTGDEIKQIIENS